MKNKNRNGKEPRSAGRVLYSILSVFLILFFLIAAGAGIAQIRERLSSDGYDYYEEACMKLGIDPNMANDSGLSKTPFTVDASEMPGMTEKDRKERKGLSGNVR